MTGKEYQAIRELIETKFRQDMAALERVWFTINGANPPDSPVALVPAESEAALPAGSMEPPAQRKHSLSDAAKAKKRAYMKAYWQKKKGKGT